MDTGRDKVARLNLKLRRDRTEGMTWIGLVQALRMTQTGSVKFVPQESGGDGLGV